MQFLSVIYLFILLKSVYIYIYIYIYICYISLAFSALTQPYFDIFCVDTTCRSSIEDSFFVL